jgi:hypothetical protein
MPAVVGWCSNAAKVNQQAPMNQLPVTAINAPVGHSVRWMGCIFSFNIKWGSSQFIFFHC